MDLSLHGGLLWRYWYIVLPGLALAVVLALLSVARPVMDGNRPTLEYRDPVLWGSTSTLLLTRPGFPEGRLFPTTDEARLARIAQLYARLVPSDDVMKRLRRQGRFDGSLGGRAVLTDTGDPAPLLTIAVHAATPQKALALTRRATATFVAYVRTRQTAAGIARSDRIKLQVVQEASRPGLAAPRKRTLAIVVFLATLSFAVGLVYVLETTRLRRQAARPVKPVGQEPEQEPEPAGEALTSRRWA